MRRGAVMLAVVALALVACATVLPGGLDVALLPAVALFFLLARGCFPGEEILVRLARARSRRRRRAPLARARPGVIVDAPRGTLLLALGLAVRPPPVVAHHR